MNRTMSTVCLLSFLLAVRVSVVGCASAAAPDSSSTLSLAGVWRFELDRADAGIRERWFERALAERLKLPGALQNQGHGDDITVDTAWTGDVGGTRWKTGASYARYREPGNIKVPFFLQPEKHYVGAAWYQRQVEIPPGWQGRRVVLTLERPHWETRLWVDGIGMGTNDSLGTPHVYDLGTRLSPGPHTLTLRVDNRILVEVGHWSHSVSDHTQGNWNGIVGDLRLDATGPVWIEDLQVFPNAAARTVRVRVATANPQGLPIDGKLTLAVEPGPSTPPLDMLPSSKNYRTDLTHIVDDVWEIALGDSARLWDEFSPALYVLRAELRGQIRGADFVAGKTVRFGLRDIRAAGRQFLLNGRPLFLRGTLECCIFPLTGHPPTGVEPWKKLLRACRAHGLNHLRFHSWCPPEAAFAAADELGFYYQVECGVWTEPGSGRRVDTWLYEESERIVRAYGHHPSFLLFTHGNEPHGPKHKEYLAAWVDHWKKDPRRLVTSGSAYPQLPENQYHVYHPCRGPHGWLGRDYAKDVAALDVPVVVHEMGQWCVYPNFDEIPKYTGPLKPRNFEIFRDSLAEHGMLGQAWDFLRASGRLQVLCYKEEIEAALRTPGIGGVQLLDLHDFPGQGTALVGVLDPFWEPKGYVAPEEFRRFCGPTVPLARLTRRTWTLSETLRCEVELAHYGPAPLADARVSWALVDPAHIPVREGRLQVPTASGSIPIGSGLALGRIETELAGLAAPAAYRLVVRVEAQSGPVAENDWPLWVYPEAAAAASGVTVVEALDEATLERLEAGGRVVLATSRISPVHPALTFEPIFWNRYMFNTQPRQTLGLLCRENHPALARFPTSFFQDWQWHDIVTRARGLVLDDLPPALQPIVQPIDDWNTNRKLGLLFECRVGRGRLLVCTADLTRDLDQRPAARQLRASLLAYAAGDAFDPAVAVDGAVLARLLHRAARSTLVNLGARVVRADSEDGAHGNTAQQAIDGDPDTIWHTAWGASSPAFPHELVIDLQREVDLRGFRLLPRQDMQNGWFTAYAFHVSPDGRAWNPPAAEGAFAADPTEKVVEFARPHRGRFIRLVATRGHRNQPWAAVAELDVLLVPDRR
ncbi:MAG: discoidin domain-containing protein [Verrucomicrobia bacterium]|nr:discoidin domain-containing protein [Verrucomicrobiota bacterium]